MFGELKSVSNEDPTVDVLEKELLQVVPKGDVKRVRELVELIDNLNIHALGALGNTCFCPPNHDACTPLSLAISYGHFEIVKILVEAGSDIDFYIGWDDSDTDEWYGLDTPLYDALLLYRSGRKSDGMKLIQYLIDAGANHEILHWQAIWSDDLDVFKMMIEKREAAVKMSDPNKKIVDERDEESGNTLLMAAAENGSVEVAKYLISEGASTKLRNKKDQNALVIVHEKINFELNFRLKLEFENVEDVTEKMVKKAMKEAHPNIRSYMQDLFDVAGILENETPEQHHF